MKTTEQWLHEYSESHQNKTNQMIHKLCVPLIFFSLMGMLWDLQLHEVRVTYIAALLAMLFYIRLGVKVAVLMLVQMAVFFAILSFWSQQQFSIFMPNLWIFAFAWLGQFIGHKLEGKSPSFFQDLQFLLIGPIWIFSFAFKK